MTASAEGLAVVRGDLDRLQKLLAVGGFEEKRGCSRFHCFAADRRIVHACEDNYLCRGRDLARVTTAQPFDIESREGLSEFVVLSDQLVADSGEAA